MILAAVCARGGSKGVPGKALRVIGGRSLIAHAIECALNCSIVDRVVVSTEDHEIAEEASRFGAEVPFIRPLELATDDSPKWDVFRHLVEWMEDNESVSVDILVDLDAGVPLRQPADVEACVKLLDEKPADVAVTAFASHRNPYFNMVELAENGLVKIVKGRPQPIHNRQAAPDVFSLSPAVYAIRRNALNRWAHWSQAPMAVHIIPRERAWDVDSEIDLKFVDYIFALKDQT